MDIPMTKLTKTTNKRRKKKQGKLSPEARFKREWKRVTKQRGHKTTGHKTTGSQNNGVTKQRGHKTTGF